jgi:cellulose synthase/poly-beta-1,6-N-acetylglucosamine synthase-like glycosyltransferase
MMGGNNMFLLTLFVIFCVAAVMQLFYYLWFYLAPVLSENNATGSEDRPVSIIICARNEAENLRKFLPSVLEQDYPSFEVIVVNDCSEDSSDDVLGEMLLKYPHLKISSINKDPKFTHSKKFAQFIGIRAAENELLLFTDADCRPESEQWLRRMSSGFSNGTDFVLGYGGYFKEKGLLNSYIRYDTLFIAMQYLGMALRGVPYMGVGRNLAWRKSVFFINKGFGAHNNLASGDDDLFVNANATGASTRVEFHPEAHTRSVPASSVAQWIKQKQRHLTTAKYYKLRNRMLLIPEPISRVLFYSSFIILICSLYLWPYLLGLFVVRLIIQTVILSLTGRRLNELGNVIPSVIFDLFSPLINISIYLSTFRKRGDTKWK